ncbi:hypothetical protein MY8738_004946 [Beauveria namnaoensis]
MATGYSDLEVYHGTAATGPIPVQEEKIFTQITTKRQEFSNLNCSKPPSRREKNLCSIQFTRTRALLLVLLFVLLAAVAAGVAAGLVVARSSKSRGSSSSGEAISSSSSGVPSSASSATPTSVTRGPATLVTSTEVVSPTQTLYRDCPSSDNTIYNGKGSDSYQFRKICARSYKQPPVNLVNQPVASLNDCIDKCAEYNIRNKTAIASGKSNPCNAVCWRNSATDPDWPGQCFGSTTFNSTEGFQTRDEIICDSAAWINQNI